MILYYGSDSSFDKPEFNFGNTSNDYGQGFYLTPDWSMAKLWAGKFEDGGFVVTFDVNLDKLNICSLNDSGEQAILRWISLLSQHRFSFVEKEKYKQELEWLSRKYPFDTGQYDMIVGYRADDSYFKYSKDFVANDISIDLLGRAMRLGKLGLQYVLISEKSFTAIQEINREIVLPSDEYEIFKRSVLGEYNILKTQDDKIHNPTLLDFMRKNP